MSSVDVNDRLANLERNMRLWQIKEICLYVISKKLKTSKQGHYVKVMGDIMKFQNRKNGRKYRNAVGSTLNLLTVYPRKTGECA